MKGTLHSKRLAGDGDFIGYCYLLQMYDIGITAVFCCLPAAKSLSMKQWAVAMMSADADFKY